MNISKQLSVNRVSIDSKENPLIVWCVKKTNNLNMCISYNLSF